MPIIKLSLSEKEINTLADQAAELKLDNVQDLIRVKLLAMPVPTFTIARTLDLAKEKFPLDKDPFSAFSLQEIYGESTWQGLERRYKGAFGQKVFKYCKSHNAAIKFSHKPKNSPQALYRISSDNSLRVFTWNAHNQGRRGARDLFPVWLKEYIPADLDVIVLTEFNHRADNILELLKKRGFKYITTTYSEGNDVLIAVSDKVTVKSAYAFEAYKTSEKMDDWYLSNIQDIKEKAELKEPGKNHELVPENLILEAEVNGKPITLVGLRIKELGADYKKRHEEMELILDMIKTNNVCILGDMNNLFENKKTAQLPWNLTVLKKMSEDKHLDIYTPMNCSWGAAEDQEGNIDGYIQEDHLIVSNNLTCKIKPYNWTFMQDKLNEEGYTTDTPTYFGIPIKSQIGYPDHGILEGIIQL